MCKDLIYHGIVPRKSGKECIPDTIPQDLIRHFIRGFFDGDGWVSISSSLVFGLCGMSANIMIDIDDYFKNTINISGNLKRKDNYQVRFFNYNIYSNNAKKVFEHIYQDASIFLTRKKDKFDEYNK